LENGREGENYWNVSLTDDEIGKIRHIYRPGSKNPGI